LETEVNGEEIRNHIYDWLQKNTMKGSFNESASNENRIDYEQVRIPLFDERKRSVDARQFAVGLQKHLKLPPFNIESKLMTRGLGEAILVLGIVLNCVVLENGMKIPEESKLQLANKIQQIAANNGLGGNSINQRFVLAARPNVTSKDFIAGPPQMIVLNLELVLFIGDAMENLQFYSLTFYSKGVGINENKAYISAIQNINPRNKEFSTFLSNGKGKIVEYYEGRCESIQARAKALSEKQDYDAAIYELMQVPDASSTCYKKALIAVQPIFRQKIDKEGKTAYLEASRKWGANPNTTGAKEALTLLGNIDPSASAYKDAVYLSEDIQKKISEAEKREWDFKMKTYQDGVNLEKQKINAVRQAAVEYFKNQPKTIVYNRIIW
jgi:hypothetical protein